MRKKLQIAVGLLVGAVILWVLFRDTDWGAVYEAIRNASVGWILLSQVPIWGSFLSRVQRWSYIVRAATPARFRTLFAATQIGFLANFVLPLRVGELIRPLVLSRRTGIHFSKGIASVALDRVTDLFGAAACTLVTLLAIDLTRPVVVPAGTLGITDSFEVSQEVIRGLVAVLGISLVGSAVCLTLLYVKQRWFLSLVERFLGKVSARLARSGVHLLGQFAEGLSVLRSGTDIVKALAWSLVVWGMFVLASLCFFEAFAIDYPWYAPFLLQTLLAMAVTIPGPPGFVGPFHLAVYVCLMIAAPGGDTEVAKAAAIVMHLANLIPVVIAGLIGLALENASLLELTRESEVAEAHTATEPLD